MPAIHIDDITDSVNASLEKHETDCLVDVAQAYQNMPAMQRLYKKASFQVSSGNSYKYPILTEYDSNTRFTSLFGKDDLDQVDGTVYADIPWRMITTGTTFDIGQEEVNHGKQKLYDFVASKEQQMLGGFFATGEQSFWRGPTSSTDNLTWFGLLYYWLDYAGYSAGGMEGGNHANWSGGPAGVSCATTAGWKHYVNNYAVISETDAMSKLEDAFYYAKFEAPQPMPIKPPGSATQKWGVYTTWTNIKTMKNLAKSQNDNIGFDLDPVGAVTFNRIPIEPVSYLSTNHATSAPIIGINWSQFFFAVRNGKWMVKTPYRVKEGMHTVRERFMDCTGNFGCYDRRTGLFLLAKSNPMSD